LNKGISLDNLEPSPSCREQGGEGSFYALEPATSEGRKKKCAKKREGVPPWLRRRLPLLVVDGECAWLGGFGATAGWPGLVFDWHNQAHFVKIPHLFDNGSDRLA